MQRNALGDGSAGVHAAQRDGLRSEPGHFPVQRGEIGGKSFFQQRPVGAGRGFRFAHERIRVSHAAALIEHQRRPRQGLEERREHRLHIGKRIHARIAVSTRTCLRSRSENPGPGRL
jgi:hypothetical protein